VFKYLSAIFLVLALIAPSGAPSGVFAQEGAPLSIVEVDLWPEFDQPSMLVIYHITLASQVSLPFQVEMRIPAEAGAPHAVAVKQPGGGLISIPYQQQAEQGWIRVTFQATAPEIQLEYYDPSLRKNGSQRTYQYVWPGDYAVSSLGIEVQRPKDATDMQIKPGMVSAHQGNDGLMYYSMNVGSLEKGQVFDISIEYQKDTDALSASDMPVEPSAPLEGSFPGEAGISNFLPVLLGILGFALIVGGAFWYWRSGLRKEAPQQDTRRRHKPPALAVESSADDQVYCHQCGKRALPGDQFCRACGSQLRTN